MEAVKSKEKSRGSETKPYQEMDFLVQNGEWQSLIGNEHYQNMSRIGRIIIVHKAISVRLDQLNQHYNSILNSDSRSAVQFLETQINPLHNYRDYLSQAIAWQEKGEESTPPPDILKDHLR